VGLYSGDREAEDTLLTTRVIASTSSGIGIELVDVGGGRAELLAAFGECQRGVCTCPTDEYRKVDVMEVEANEDGISIRLRAIDGESFDVDAIAACLDYSVEKAAKK
jgi:hypothetical protein